MATGDFMGRVSWLCEALAQVSGVCEALAQVSWLCEVRGPRTGLDRIQRAKGLARPQ